MPFCVFVNKNIAYFHDKNTSCDVYGYDCRVKARLLSSFSDNFLREQLLFSSDITVMEMKNLIKGFCIYLVYYISLKNLAKYLKNPEKSRKSLKNKKNLKKI